MSVNFIFFDWMRKASLVVGGIHLEGMDMAYMAEEGDMCVGVV